MSDYYKEIDELPLFNWIKINNGKNEYARKDLSIGNSDEDEKHFEILTDSNYSKFGIGKEYINLLDMYLELSELNLDLVITGDRFLLNRKNLLEGRIEDLLKKDGGNFDVYDSVVSLSKWMGYRLDVKSITVLEYRKMIDLFKKENGKENK